MSCEPKTGTENNRIQRWSEILSWDNKVRLLCNRFREVTWHAAVPVVMTVTHAVSPNMGWVLSKDGWTHTNRRNGSALRGVVMSRDRTHPSWITNLYKNPVTCDATTGPHAGPPAAARAGRRRCDVQPGFGQVTSLKTSDVNEEAQVERKLLLIWSLWKISGILFDSHSAMCHRGCVGLRRGKQAWRFWCTGLCFGLSQSFLKT